MTLTMTKTRVIAKSIRRQVNTFGPILPQDELMRMASRYQISLDELRKLVVALGYEWIEGLNPDGRHSGESPPKPPKPLVPAFTKKAIRSHQIFRVLALTAPGETIPDSAIVTTTYGQLRRQAEALENWLEEAARTGEVDPATNGEAKSK